MATRNWSNLPADILSSIADRLGIIELLSFRGVCKDWRSSSSSASALIESSPQYEPWLLLYGSDMDEHECTLYTQNGSYHPLRIPEMHGATCIASNQGWLLLFNKGSIFFFCPFSRARIDLPNFPQSKISSHVAAFSAPPTSLDCIVSVIKLNDQHRLELKLLARGAKTWTEYQFNCSSLRIDMSITFASFNNGIFFFLNDKRGVLAYDVNGHQLVTYGYPAIQATETVPSSLRTSKLSSDFFKRILASCTRTYFHDNNVKLLGWDHDISFSICGTRKQCCCGDKLFANESVKVIEEGSTRSSKGVWLEPRFFQVPPDQNW